MVLRLMFGVMLALAPAAVAQDSLPPLEEETVDTSVADRNLDALRRVQSYMDGVKSLKAEFSQRAPNGQVNKGTVYLERPGRVRFDYADDTPFLVVADGKTLNFVDYEVGQVTKWPVKETPMRALLGGSVDLASVSAHIQLEPAGIPDLLALSARDPKQPEAGEITLYFKTGAPGAEDGGLTLLSWAVADARGEMTYVELSNQTVNPVLDDKLWTFEDPRGLKRRRGVR